LTAKAALLLLLLALGRLCFQDSPDCIDSRDDYEDEDLNPLVRVTLSSEQNCLC